MSSVEKDSKWGPASGSRRMRIVETGTRLHRIAEVMEQERVSPRAAAQRMNLTASQAQAEAHPHSDLLLSELYRWQRALNVPLVEILREPDDRLSPQIEYRSRLLKAMRTVRSIQDRTEEEPVRALVMTLAQQLLELMPELQHVSAWPVFGHRRTSDDLGAVFDKQISIDCFGEGFCEE